jgi:hypothetical protein
MVLFRTRRRVVVNGHLVESATIEFKVYWAKFFVLLWSFLILWFSNPYNNPDIHLDAVTFAGHHWTNYAMFSVRSRRRGDGFTLYALGQDVTCYYDNDICRSLKDFLCHEKPLLWHAKDRAYTTHHILLLVYVLVGCLRWCTNLDSMVHQDSYAACVFSLLVPTWSSWFEARWFLYPAWERMNAMVPIQQTQSLFRIFESTGANYAFSVLLFYLVAASCLYGTRHYWTPRHQPYPVVGPSSHLSAMALGFVRGSLAHGGPAARIKIGNNGGGGGGRSDRFHFSPFPVRMSSLSATWTVLAIQVATGGVAALVPWWVAHMLGALVGTYQYQNQEIVYLVDSLWTGLLESFQSLFQF